MIEFISDPERKKEIASAILYALPDWFGIPESTRSYIEGCAALPFWAYRGEDGACAGFIALRETSPYAAEIFVMGVLPELHRKGVGRRLFLAFHEYAKARGYAFLHVKTVDAGLFAEYDRTRLFYESLGFQKLEVFPTLWDERNPCLVMVMHIG